MRGMRNLFIGAQMLYIGLSLQWGVGIFNRQMWVAASSSFFFFFLFSFFLRREKRYINTLFPVSYIRPWRKIKPHNFIRNLWRLSMVLEPC